METQYCPQCGKANTAGFRFCQNCGAALGQAPLATTAPESVPAQRAARSRGMSPALSPAEVVAEGPPAPASVTLAAQTRPLTQPRPGYMQQSIGQMGTGGFSAVDIWGPFAGYGERGRHVSWLLDSLGERAEALRDAVTNRFREREIPSARIELRTLTGRGIAVERRPYYLIRRGITTAGLYIAQFGQDLFISQVSYAKGAINPLRVLILALMLVFQAFMVFGYGASISSAAESAIGSFDLFGGYGGGGGGGALGFLLCCIGPLGMLNTLGLSLAGLHIAYKFFAEKDPLALLRTPPNEFQLDDIVALEKAVEETVRQSLDVVGIDTALMPSAAEYGFKRRLI